MYAKRARFDREYSAQEKRDAHRRVALAVRSGRIPRPALLRCTDCGRPAAHYDHHRGYAPEHALSVQPVCVACHWQRTYVPSPGSPPRDMPHRIKLPAATLAFLRRTAHEQDRTLSELIRLIIERELALLAPARAAQLNAPDAPI